MGTEAGTHGMFSLFPPIYCRGTQASLRFYGFCLRFELLTHGYVCLFVMLGVLNIVQKLTFENLLGI